MVSLRYLVMSIWSTVLFVFVCANASLYDNHPEVIDLTSSNWEVTMEPSNTIDSASHLFLFRVKS